MSFISISKIFYISLIPLYLSVCYYLYKEFSTEIEILKDERQAMLVNQNEILSNIKEKIKKINDNYMTGDSIIYTATIPKTRLSDKLNQLESYIKILNDDLLSISNDQEREVSILVNEFEKEIPNQLTEEYVKSIINQVRQEKGKSVSNVIQDNDGPTRNVTMNEEIKLSDEVKRNFTEKYLLVTKEFNEIKSEVLMNYKLYENEYFPLLDEYLDKQWRIIERIGQLNNKYQKISNEIDNLKKSLSYSNDELSKIDISNDEFSKLSIYDKYRLAEIEIDHLENMYSTIQSSKDYIENVNIVNFGYDSDYNLLTNYFKQAFNYKRLISNHNVLSKDLFSKQLSKKSNLFIYIELESKRRVGFYIKQSFPKKSNVLKEVKDDDSFICFFNKNEIYKANPESSSHYKLDNDYLIIVGNSLSDDGFWIQMESISETLKKPIMTIGFKTLQYQLGKGSLFSGVHKDKVKSFEVFQLDFSK